MDETSGRFRIPVSEIFDKLRTLTLTPSRQATIMIDPPIREAPTFLPIP